MLSWQKKIGPYFATGRRSAGSRGHGGLPVDPGVRRLRFPEEPRAFGLLAYESAWLRYRYPAEYYAALFNNQPMGFYSTEVLAGDARRHGVELVRPDINLSGVGCTVETDRRIRLAWIIHERSHE